ncbi:CNH domain-containing protein [Kalaharituber pfeilii]|nr:CNH domain-containing protein [Kalaharituber pfeilii]
MANSNDHRYRNGPPGGSLHYSQSFASQHAPQYGRRSRTPSFDGGDEQSRLTQPSVQGNEEMYYNSQYMDQSGTQTMHRSQSAAQATGSYFGSPPGNPDVSGYSAQQASDVSYSAGYQQPQADISYGTAPYPTTPSYNGGQPTQRPPYNPAAYQGPTRHASTATSPYASTPPQYSQNVGNTYNPSTYNTAPFSTMYTQPAKVTQQPYYSNVPTSTYNQYPSRPQYTPQSQQAYGIQQQTASYTNQTAYRPPPPPPPPPGHPPGSPPNYGSSGYGGQSYNPLPYPSQDSQPYPSQSFVRPETHYSSDSELSQPGNNAAIPFPSPPSYGYDMQTMPSPPPPPVPAHGYLPERSESTRHPQSRPLPERPYPTYPEDYTEPIRGDSECHGQTMYRDDTDDVDDDIVPDPLFSRPIEHKPENGPSASNGFLDTSGGGYGETRYTGYSSTSDAEATAGLEAMRLAEAVEAEINARTAAASASAENNTLTTSRVEDDGSDEGTWGVDLELYGGGVGYYGSHSKDNSYANDPKSLARNASTATYSTNDSLARTTSVMTTSTAATTITQDSIDDNRNSHIQGGQNWDIPDDYQLHPFREFQSAARVDTSGTGGLAEPKLGDNRERRLSFDEGEEEMIQESQSSGKWASDDDSYPQYPELFYHPEPSVPASRPLPSVPHEPGLPAHPAVYKDSQARLSTSRQSTVPPVPGTNVSVQAPQFPRSSSLSSHGSTPVTVAPARSKTDAAAAAKGQNRMSIRVTGSISEFEQGPPTPSDSLISHLPALTIPKKKFEPSKISSREFRKCTAPWALSSIVAWIKELADGEQYLKERTVEEGIAALFNHYVPTMNIADAESLAAKVVRSMLAEGALVKDEEWVKFGDGQLCGVIYQICGGGCYAPKLHEQECSGRCYSHHCSRTLKKITLLPHPDEPQQKAEDWATYWKIRKENIAEVSKKEIERQNNLHEIVQTESEYMEHLWVLTTVYRDQILRSNPPIIQPSKLHDFVKDVFGKADAVRKVSEEHLLPQLKFRQREQGPWIVGFSDIFREWVRKAKNVYIEYASNFPNADWLVRREADRNLVFRAFLEQCRQDPRTRRLDWVTFLKAPITRLQRYSLLLSTVLKHTIADSEEKQNLTAAIEEIKAVTLECDARVDEQTKHVTLKELGQKLVMRPGMEVNLRLTDPGREVILRGDLQRHTSKFIETHAILFDHYLILAKSVQQKDVASSTKHEKYDVSRMPIPMGLLVLESANDEPVVRGAANLLGLGGPSPVRPGAAAIAGRPGQLNHPNTNLGYNSPPEASNSEKFLYPFRIKHLGKPTKSDENTYTLYAPSAQIRQEWCEKIILAQEKHAASLHAQNAEPFRLRVMADTAFGYETTNTGPKPIAIKGTPLDRAIREVEGMFQNAGQRPPVICRAAVNCATSFRAQLGAEMVAIGTDYGVYISDANNPRGWVRAIPIAKVTQVAVLEDFSLFLVLADKALIAYHLDVVIPNGRTDVSKRAPQKLSGARDVGFFTTGKLSDRTIVIYKKREGLSAIFKVFEPVFQKATEKRGRFSRKGTTDFFREFDEFYIPTDCYGLNLFQSSLAVQTSKGFEVVKLDTKRPTSVPELQAAHVTAIANRLSNQRPLGMFRLSDIEFLLCYEDCAVYCNKHGDVSRSVIMEFVGKAKTAAIYGPYILLFDSDFVEIRNAENGRLRQVIAGRDCKCLDDGRSGSQTGRTIKLGMAHPEYDGRQLVVELILNEGQND